MATVIVSYAHPGLIRLHYQLEVQFNRGTHSAETLRLDIQVHIDQEENVRAAEDFYFPIFAKEAADTIRGYFGGKGQQVSVFDRQLRPGFDGNPEFLGVTREQFKTRLGDFRQQIIHALAMLG
jgi:hypothetical protein